MLFRVVFGLAIVAEMFDVFPATVGVDTFGKGVGGPLWVGFVPDTQLKVGEVSFQEGFSRVSNHVEQGEEGRRVVGILLQEVSTGVFHLLLVGISKEEGLEGVDFCDRGCRGWTMGSEGAGAGAGEGRDRGVRVAGHVMCKYLNYCLCIFQGDGFWWKGNGKGRVSAATRECWKRT